MLIYKGKFEEAIVYLEKARAVNPREKETYFNLGTTYANIEDYVKTEGILKILY